MNTFINTFKINELKISLFFNKIVSNNTLLHHVLKFITAAGEWWMYLVYAIFSLIFLNAITSLNLIKIGAIAFCFHYPIYYIIKNSTKRKRPCDKSLNIIALVKPPDKYSMPSGHSSGTTIIALTLIHTFPNYNIILFIPILVALSRFMLGVHYISDTIVGMLLGYFCFNVSLYLIG